MCFLLNGTTDAGISDKPVRSPSGVHSCCDYRTSHLIWLPKSHSCASALSHYPPSITIGKLVQAENAA